MTSWPFESLTPLKYGVISADCPWRYQMYSDKGYDKSPEAHYDTMTKERLAELPVNDLASGDCLLVMWSTWPHLAQALEVMRAWGFTYKTGGAWHKKTRHGKTAFGTGYLVRSSCEPYLIGTIGEPKIRSRSERNVIETCHVEDFPQIIEAERREHSRKPDEMRHMLERLCPDVFMCELFAREPWDGNDVWGNEATKYAEPN